MPQSSFNLTIHFMTRGGKTMKKSIFKRLISGVISGVMILSAASIFPSPTATAVIQNYPYTLFAAGYAEKTVNFINTHNLTVNGGVCTNGTFFTTANHVNGDVRYFEEADEDMIYIFDKIKSTYFSKNVKEYNDDYSYCNMNINLSSAMLVEGELELTGNINLNSGVMAMGDIVLNGEVKNSNNSVIFSKYGDVVINNYSNVNLNNGLIYAPFGNVEINSMNINISGIIIAQSITFNGASVNVNYSNNIGNLVGTESEDLNIPNDEWKYFKDVNENGLPDLFENDDNWHILPDSNSDGCPDLIEEFLGNVDMELDSDEDGILDWYEIIIGTDPYNADTDGDNLPDGYEIYSLDTNPLSFDTDSNGVWDRDEDFDNDGLTNFEEYQYGTEPYHQDSDHDLLSDYDELFVYATNPLIYDSDDDGLSDGLELTYGMNPLNPDTLNDGIFDGDRVYTVVKTAWDWDVEDTVRPILEIELKGTQIDTLSIGKVSENDMFLNSNIPGYLGNTYDFNVEGIFDSATLSYEFSPDLLDDSNFIPAIYYWDEDEQFLFELENQVVEGNKVSAPIEHFSKYMVIAKNSHDEALFEFEILPPTDEEMQNKVFDVALVLDESGSISSSNFSLMKTVSANLINELDDEDRISLFTFDNTVRKRSGFVEKNTAVSVVNGLVQNNGNTAIYDAINTANNEFSMNSSGNATKIMILLTDGQDNASRVSTSSVIQFAADNNIIIFTVGIGSVNSSILNVIATSTGGAYYSGSNFSQLKGIFDRLQAEVDLYRDSDGDSISDYHEKKIASSEIKLGTGAPIMNFTSLNYLNPDSDGDSLCDGQEFEIRSQYVQGTSIYYCFMVSNPCINDSDSDGYLDSEDANPLKWDISDRDLAMAATISYSIIPKGSNFDTLSTYWKNDLNTRLSGAAYIEELKGWKVLDTWYAKGGLQALVLQKDDNIIMAYRGTEPGGGNGWELFADWFNNGMTYLFGVSTQTPAAKKFMKNTMKSNPGKDFHVVGHSLGGHLAYNAAAQGIDYNSSVIKSIVTFNGLGLTFGGFGLGDVWDEWQLNKKLSVIRNYMVEGDPVSKGFLGGTTVHYGISYTWTKHQDAPDEHSLYTFLVGLTPLNRPNSVMH